jgi:hypothetical protein
LRPLINGPYIFISVCGGGIGLRIGILGEVYMRLGLMVLLRLRILRLLNVGLRLGLLLILEMWIERLLPLNWVRRSRIVGGISALEEGL